MSRTYNIIDADGHVLEPPDFWQEYMDPKFRDRAPQLFVDTDGQERLRIEGKVLGGPKGLGFAGAIGARQGAAPTNIRYIEGRKGGFDPHARIPDMDLDGIDAAVLYPTIGLFCGAASDSQLSAAMCRAYNRWLADYCKPYPDRLFGAAMLPLQSSELAIAEMRYARKELGMRSGFVRPDPYLGRSLDHKDYEPFWAEAQELDFAIGLHEGTGVHEGPGATPAMGVDRVTSHGAKHIVSHTMEMMIGLLECDLGRCVRAFPQGADCLSRIRWRLDCWMVGPHGPPFPRRRRVRRLRATAETKRVFSAPMLGVV